MRIDIVTLFPELCDGFLSTSILGRARAKNLFEAHCHQIRDYTKNKQRQTDDYPYGGGCGMVLYAQPIADCLRAVADQCAQQGRAKPHVVFLTAAGQPYNEETARRLSSYESLALVCGHYEGIDQRVIDTFGDEEISIGDYVLTGGELASLVVADSVLRLQPGVLAEEKGYQDESYWDGLLEYPQYTRPEVWEGRAVPPVLLTGDHNKIDAWRGRQSRERTRQRRPDLYDQWCATHPITQIPRWKRTERAQLIKTDAQLDAAAKLFAEGCRTVCRDVCTEAGLAEYTPEAMRQRLEEERKAGWAFYLHTTSDTPDGMVGVCHKTGEIGHLFVQCAPLFGALFLFNLIESMPKLVMEGTLAYKYQLYFNALFFPAQAILLSIGFVYKPQLLRLSSIWANPRKRRRFDLIIIAVMALIVAITGVCAAFMAGPGIPLMSFMYGLNFERYRTLALLMVVAGGVTAAIDFIYAIITVLRHAGDVTKIYLICFAVSVVLPVILINLLGLMGAVVSYLAVMALLLVLLIIEYAHIRQRIERDRNPYGA